MSQARNFTITDHNHVDLDHLKSLKGLKYLFAQREKAPTTGKEHWQGYLIFNSPKRLATMFKQAKGAHIEQMKGTPASNDLYCSKAETAILDSDGNHVTIEHGIKPDMTISQGQRTDLADIQQLIAEGNSMEDIADTNFEHWLRYGKSFMQYSLMKQPKRNFKTNVYYYVGPSGTGKSRLASERAQNPYYKNTGKWWDGYDGTADIIIDDFTGNIPFTELLRLTDRYPHTVETKGAMINFAPKNIFITTNLCIMDIYPDHFLKHPAHANAIGRRITENIIFDKSTYGLEKENWSIKKILQEKTCLQEDNDPQENKCGGET